MRLYDLNLEVQLINLLPLEYYDLLVLNSPACITPDLTNLLAEKSLIPEYGNQGVRIVQSDC